MHNHDFVAPFSQTAVVCNESEGLLGPGRCGGVDPEYRKLSPRPATVFQRNLGFPDTPKTTKGSFGLAALFASERLVDVFNDGVSTDE